MTGSVAQWGDFRKHPLAPRRGSLLEVPPGVDRAVRPILVPASAPPRASPARTMSPLHQDHHRDVDSLGCLFHGGCIGTTCRNVQGGPTLRRDQGGAPISRTARAGGG